jgi:hypothetical protein
MERGRVNSINVAVEVWDKSPLADIMIAKIYIGVEFAAELIQVSTILGISRIAVIVKLSC